MSIFDAAVHSDMHDDMRKSLLALWERMTIIEQGLLSNNIDDALRLTRIQDALTARVNGIDATLAAYCIDALQLKPTEPTSTPERCHIGGCVNPLPPYIFPFCAKCGLPTCTAHVYEHPAPLEDDADNTAGWCKTCHDTATQPEPVQRAYVMIADECGVTECTTRVEPDESNQCNHCGKPTCWAHKNHPDVMYCDDCWNGMRDTPTQPATDDGPATCYICGIDHDLEDVATCTQCTRTVCHDHSIAAPYSERICTACGFDGMRNDLNTMRYERDGLIVSNKDLNYLLIITEGRVDHQHSLFIPTRQQLEYAEDAIEELQCQLLDAQQEHTKTMRLLSRLTTRAKNRLNSIGTIVDLETIDLSTPESEEE